jgi:hypothetical protein
VAALRQSRDNYTRLLSRGGRKRNLRRRLHDADLVLWPFIQFEFPSRMFKRSRRQHPHTPNQPCWRSRRLAAKRMPRRSAPPCSNNAITDCATRVGRRVRGDRLVTPSRCVRELHEPGEQAPYPGRDRNVTPPTSEGAADTTSINSDRWAFARTAQWTMARGCAQSASSDRSARTPCSSGAIAWLRWPGSPTTECAPVAAAAS